MSWLGLKEIWWMPVPSAFMTCMTKSEVFIDSVCASNGCTFSPTPPSLISTSRDVVWRVDENTMRPSLR